MHEIQKTDAMLAAISADIELLEQELMEKYRSLIRVSSEFDDIVIEFVLLERKSLTQVTKEYEAITIVDKLCERVVATFGIERDRISIFQAAMAVMDENTSAAMSSRN